MTLRESAGKSKIHANVINNGFRLIAFAQSLHRQNFEMDYWFDCAHRNLRKECVLKNEISMISNRLYFAFAQAKAK